MIAIDSVGYESDALKDRAQALAYQLHLKLQKEASPCLWVCENKLALKIQNFSPLSPDFKADSWTKRRAEGKSQALIKACKPKPGMKILDATAGWGRDAAILASFGAEIRMLERHPIMAILLEDALTQRSIMDKQKLSLSLIHTNAFDYLYSLKATDYADVIYVDPMHPERTQSALVKKEMQALQQLIGEDKDAKALIEVARSRMKMRLVVKWPQKLPPLLKPDLSIPGKTIRYDIYLAKPVL